MLSRRIAVSLLRRVPVCVPAVTVSWTGVRGVWDAAPVSSRGLATRKRVKSVTTVSDNESSFTVDSASTSSAAVFDHSDAMTAISRDVPNTTDAMPVVAGDEVPSKRSGRKNMREPDNNSSEDSGNDEKDVHELPGYLRRRQTGLANQAVSLLDDPQIDLDRQRPVRERSKVSQPLEKPQKRVLDPASQGMQEAIAEEILENLNAALSSKAFHGLMRGAEYPGDVIDIVLVRINQDYSHVHAIWHSDILERILISMAAEPRGRSLRPRDALGSQEMIGNVNALLQTHEGKFRSHFIKQFNFRRVPRIYFQHSGEIGDLLQHIDTISKENSSR